MGQLGGFVFSTTYPEPYYVPKIPEPLAAVKVDSYLAYVAAATKA